MKRPQYVFRPNLNEPQHRRAWALLQQVPPAKRKEFLVQSIKQILEPICEAKFSNNSYGFRPNRSVEHAISRTYSLLQRAHLHYVLEFDIKGFFDNVNHSKLIRQLWSLGIQDKQLLFVIKRILKAPIRMPDGTTEYPTKGTPQGGIISPLLANVVLNELDHWIDSQWVEHPLAVSHAYRRIIRTSEVIDKSKGYVMMRRTGLKEMFIVRYADDFRIFCRNREDAERTMASVTQWITERLHLEVSPEKTRIVNVRKRYSEFLGFKIRVFRKGEKYVVRSHICDKKLQLEERKLVEQAKHIANPTEGKSQPAEIGLFDEMVLGINNVGFWDSIPLWAVTLIGGLLITVLSFTMILTVYGRMFSLWMYAAIAPIPLSTFAGEPTSSVGKNFIRSYADVCLQGVVIALSCIIFSAISSSPPAVDTGASVVTAVWTYVGELAFNLLVLVGAIKGCDRIVKEIMGL